MGCLLNICAKEEQGDTKSESISDYKQMEDENYQNQISQNKTGNKDSLLGDDQISVVHEMDYEDNLSTRKKVSFKDFTPIKVLGRGSFGKVMLVEYKGDNKLYALKALKKDAIQKKNQIIHTKAERSILQSMKHPFIVQLHFAFQSEDRLYFVTDFMQGGELFFHLRRAYKFNEERAKLYGAELILAIEYLHKKNIIYRDLKPENILLGADGHLKITDFGLSKEGIADGVKTNTFCGTPEYLAPEILLGKGHEKSVDWYSFGALLYEMLSGAPPFYSKDKHKMLKDRLEKPIQMKNWFSQNAISILEGLLHKDSKYRLGRGGADEIKQHEFFKEINWSAVEKKQYPAPFTPKCSNDRDLRHFDKMFIDESIKDTPTEQGKIQNNQNNFDGFTYMPGKSEIKRNSDKQNDGLKNDNYIDINPQFSLKAPEFNSQH